MACAHPPNRGPECGIEIVGIPEGYLTIIHWVLKFNIKWKTIQVTAIAFRVITYASFKKFIGQEIKNKNSQVHGILFNKIVC
jgi:hypothetical protein